MVRAILPASGRAARQRLGQIRRLLQGRLGRHGRLVRVDHGLDQRRPRRRQGLAQDRRRTAPGPRSGSRRPRSRARPRRSRPAAGRSHIPGCPGTTICSHLIWPRLSFLSTTIFTFEPVLHAGRELADQHGEPAVADERHHLPLRVGERRGDRVGQAAGHAGERARAGELHAVAHGQVARRPAGVGAGIGGDDRVRARAAGRARAPPPAASSARPSGVPRSASSSRQARIPAWAVSRNERSSCCSSRGSSASRQRPASPTSAASTG